MKIESINQIQNSLAYGDWRIISGTIELASDLWKCENCEHNIFFLLNDKVSKIREAI